MDIVIDFVMDNLVPLCLGLGAFIVLVIAIIILSKKSKKVKEKSDKAKFDISVERFEKRHYKKCNKCGGNVPIEDNLCQNCGDIPN